MDYQKIKYFIKAAETLNFSEAARQMFITPQAFGRQITQLEQEMGFSLFERNVRQIKLTPSGKICYEHLHEMVEKLDNEYQKMCEMGRWICVLQQYMIRSLAGRIVRLSR